MITNFFLLFLLVAGVHVPDPKLTPGAVRPLTSVLAESQSATRHRAPVVAFMKASGYPNGRPGYVVDHIIPLCAGGADTPSNMQWQEKLASYKKDVFERALCAAMKKQGVLIVPIVKP